MDSEPNFCVGCPFSPCYLSTRFCEFSSIVDEVDFLEDLYWREDDLLNV